MDDVATLKKKIDELESQIIKEREDYELKLNKMKTENYQALEASQTPGVYNKKLVCVVVIFVASAFFKATPDRERSTSL